MQRIVGLRKYNSVDFVHRVFQCYRERTVVALLDEGQALPEWTGSELGEVLEPSRAAGWFEEQLDPIESPHPAQIVYTSGTEGVPKAIVISHGALADVAQRLNAVMRVDSTIREYVGVPVTYSFGLGRCRAIAVAGGKSFLPERGFDVLEIRGMLETGQINAISAVPTLWRLVLQNPQVFDGVGDRVRWIEIGSQYMSRSEKEQMKALFPNAVIVQHYGLTEASRTTFLVVSSVSGSELESVGRPSGSVEIRLTDDGRVQIRGPHLASGTIVDGHLEAITDDEGWLTTGDHGALEDGALYYQGRADDLINSGGVKVDPEMLQREVLTALKAERGIAICRVPDQSRGDGFFVAVEETSNVPLELAAQAVRTALSGRGINPGNSVKVQRVPLIPTTPTGKVQRGQLATLLEATPEPAVRAPQGVGLVALFEAMFEGQVVKPESTFRQLGGDSLNYVQMSIALEKELGVLPRRWDNLSIAELQASAGQSQSALPSVETNILLRAIAIIFVVATHAGAYSLGGGTLLLVFLVGYNMARFKFEALSRGEIWGPMWSYTKVLLVPYFVLGAMFMAYNREFSWDMVFLYTNVARLNVSSLFPFWFVQVLVQCLLITGILFAIRPLRELAAKHPWPFAWVTTLTFIVIRASVPLVWDTDYLRDLVPQRFIAILWLGWCCYFASTPRRRLVALAFGECFSFLDTGLDRETLWLALGTPLVLFVPQIRVPAVARNAAQLIASATFHVFIYNGIIIYASIKLLKLQSIPLIFAIGFAGSLSAWLLFEEWGLLRKVLRKLSALRRLPTLP